MPKEYESCVASYVAKGMDRQKAKGICAGAYYKAHGITVKQAHARGIEESDLVAMLEGDGYREVKRTILVEVPPSVGGIVLEEPGEDGSLRFRGTALVDNVMSSNKRYYSAEFNDRALGMTEAFLAQGGTVTMFSRHGEAVGTLFGPPTGLPIGKVPRLWREGNKILYEAEVYPTSKGSDAIMLLQKGAMRDTSVRSLWFRSRLVKDDDGNIYEEMVDAIIQGIDLAEEAGIAGAGIDTFLEEAPSLVELSELTEEVQSMKELLKELTLEELTEQRPDLVQEIAASIKESLEEAVLDPDEALPVLQEENQTLKGEKEDLEGQVADLTLKLAVQEAAQIGAGKAIAKALGEEVEAVDQIEEKLSGIKKQVLDEYLASASSEETTTVGKQRFDDEDEESKRAEQEREEAEGSLTEEGRRMVELAGGKVPQE
jgi:hypothetical protein